MYKSYFRDLYGVYAIADQANLRELQRKLKRGIYEPCDPCKIYLPKPSGILRPYTLLTVDDQIVYQAAANVIAERLAPRVRHRYNVETFGHLYASKSSSWFYRKWSDGYVAYNQAARKARADGFRYAASFDLTACYDSVDYKVLSHFLAELRFEPEFSALLTKLLSTWAAAQKLIFLNHGIPQGPLSSGLISEVVLSYFDKKIGRLPQFRYFRYVDDIRIFAKSEKVLRGMLVTLDMISKEIGLFPQSSIIAIHKVTDIEDERKSISSPTEPSIKRKVVDQKRLRKRLKELTYNLKVDHPTRFKYLLAHCEPTAEITARLLKLYERYPSIYPSVAKYMSKYKTLPGSAADKIIEDVRAQKLYPAVTAAWAKALDGRVPKDRLVKATVVVNSRYKNIGLQSDARAALGIWLMNQGELTKKQFELACADRFSWWPRAQMVLSLTPSLLQEPSVEVQLNKLLLKQVPDELAMVAGYMIAFNSLRVTVKPKDMNHKAAMLLRQVGAIRRASSPTCGVHLSLERMAGPVAAVNWRLFFRGDHRLVEKQAVQCRALAETNVSGWVNAYDVFCDWLLFGLYKNNPSLGTYVLGSIGSNYMSTRLVTQFPAVQAMVKEIHEMRYQSNLSHAIQKRGGAPTKTIRYKFLKTMKPLIQKAVQELAKP